MKRRAACCTIAASAMALLSAHLMPPARSQVPAGPANIPEPRRVSVTAKNVPLREAFGAILSQTGIQFSMTTTIGPLDETLVTLDARDQPLWETARALAKQGVSGAPLRWYATDLQGGGAYALGGPMFIDGPFLIIIRNITHRIDYSLPEDQADTLLLEGQLFSDGSLRVPSLIRQVVPTTATDDKGISLLPPPSGPPDPRPTPSNPTATSISPLPFIVTLQVPPTARHTGQKIATLEGAIPVTYQLTQNVEFAIPAAGPQTKGGYTISAEFANGAAANAQPASRVPRGAAPAGPTVTVTISRDANATTPDLINTLRSIQVRLVDANGIAFRTQGSSYQNNGASHTYTMRFNGTIVGRGVSPSGPPAKIIVQIPTDSKDITVPFHFENIALP